MALKYDDDGVDGKGDNGDDGVDGKGDDGGGLGPETGCMAS